MAALPDDLVMAHLQSGHNDALAVMFDRYQRMVFRIAVKVLHDLGEAEDMLQSIFLELHRVAAQFDPSRGSTKNWIFQFAYHRSLNRKEHLTSRKFYATTEISEVEVSASIPAIPRLQAAETQRLVRQALNTLKGAQRNVLEMVYFEGLSLQDIAERTQQSLSNVRHHYYRGLRRMRTFLLDADARKKEVCKGEAADART